MEDKTGKNVPTSPTKMYKSPQKKLLTFFEKSRDQWKVKCREAKATIKRLKNRVRWLEQSRDRWKSQAQAYAAELRQVKAEAHHRQEALTVEREQLKKTDVRRQ